MTASAPDRPHRPSQHGTVTATEQLSEHLVRLVVRCDGFADGTLEPNGFTDGYVKIELPDADGDTVLRTYTIREWRPASQELVFDFVVHGDDGIAGPWARTAEVGTEVNFRGPGGGFAPDTDESVVHLFVGDLAALPAIEAAVETIPASHNGQVVLAIEDAADVRDLATHLPVEWVVAESLSAAYDRAVEFVEAWQQPSGDLEAFVHGEAGFVRRLRRHLRVDRQVAKERQSISGYWKSGSDDAQWRQQKRDWQLPVDEAEAAVLAG